LPPPDGAEMSTSNGHAVGNDWLSIRVGSLLSRWVGAMGREFDTGTTICEGLFIIRCDSSPSPPLEERAGERRPLFHAHGDLSQLHDQFTPHFGPVRGTFPILLLRSPPRAKSSCRLLSRRWCSPPDSFPGPKSRASGPRVPSICGNRQIVENDSAAGSTLRRYRSDRRNTQPLSTTGHLRCWAPRDLSF